MLAGWWLDLPVLTSVSPSWPKMVALTALAFVLAAASLWFQVGATAPTHRRFSRICAALVVVIGALGLATRLLGWNLRLENLSIESLPVVSAVSPAGSMSAATATAFVLLGAALLLARSSQYLRVNQACVILTLLIGWLGFSRYVYGGEPLVPYAAMAIHTAAMLLLLGAGLLSLRGDVGLMALLASDRAGGFSVRRLLPAAVLVPLVAGWLALHAERVGWFGTQAALSLFALSSVVVLAVLVWANALLLERTDVKRQRAEQALHGSEERTQHIIENALDAVISIDKAGIITGWSTQAESLFGWSRGEAIGRSLAQAIVPERYREAHKQGLQRYLETGEGHVLNRRIELSALHRDGREFPIELAITPIRADDDLSFSAFVRDITERNQAQASLRESEGRLRTLAESLPHLVWTCRPDGWCDYLSRQWVEYTGLPEAEQLGYGWAEQLHSEDRERVQREWAAATVRGDSFDIEFRIRRADGTYRWFKTRAVPLRDSGGNIVKWFGSNTDFDDVKRSEERLRSQLERLNLLDRTTRAIGERQDLSSIFRVVIHRLEDQLAIDFGCACVCDAAAQTLSVAFVGAKSGPLALALEIAEHSIIDVDQNGLRRCLRGELVYEPDTRASDSPFPTRLAAAGLHSVVLAPLLVQDNVFGVMVAARREANCFTSGECEFLRQLTQHVALAAHQAQLYSALQRAYDDLRQSQQMIMQQERLRALTLMASGIAHDINNALSPAALYAQSLLERDSNLSAEARDYLVIIQRAIEDVSNTVARMREFYRPREAALTLGPVDLNHTLQQVLDLTRARWSDMPQERGDVIRAQLDLDENLPVIMGAENEIRDAITNLILNAVDAMPYGGTLMLRSRVDTRARTRGRVLIDVIDSGVGMTAAVRSHCLEPFFTTKGERGTGLGLAMVYGMVQRHSGELEIESELGVGTTLRLVFPVNAGIVDRQREATVQPLQPLRLLVIDDDPLLLESLQTTLGYDGHDVTVAEGGQAGIDTFVAGLNRSEGFSLVITDLGMPEVDGRTVAAAIKSAAPDTPVVLLTGWGHRLRAENDLPPYVDHVLSKPPRLAELRAALAELCKGRESTSSR
ncbi:MAG TPA: PAS domain S-box protein [Steroidobacteraceae bacterium]|nr:PAS domain S-box protein [Steroidobacteraceae bacterium]